MASKIIISKTLSIKRMRTLPSILLEGRKLIIKAVIYDKSAKCIVFSCLKVTPKSKHPQGVASFTPPFSLGPKFEGEVTSYFIFDELLYTRVRHLNTFAIPFVYNGYRVEKGNWLLVLFGHKVFFLILIKSIPLC